MKKICLLLLTTQITSCMELQLFKKYHRNSESEIPLNNLNQTTPSPVQVYSCEANKPGWEKLHDIANMTYKNKQQTPTQTITNLQPVYRPAEQENKLYNVIPLRPDPYLIAKIYKDARQCLSDNTAKNIISFITTMNDARTKNINEDVMGRVAYDQWNNKSSWVATETSLRCIIFFGYLKKYRLNINTTNEAIPIIDDLFKEITSHNPDNNNRLAVLLKLTTPTTRKVYDDSNYQCFRNLKAAISNLSGYLEDPYNVEKFIKDIYSDKQSSEHDFTQLSYDALKETFYNKACTFFPYEYHHKPVQFHQELYDLTKIIDAAQLLTPKKSEYDFGYDIAYQETTKNNIRTFFKYEPVIDSYRKACAILCNFIKQYNDERKTKITPTIKQFRTRNIMQDLKHFALPDTYNQTLLDEEIYAVEAFDAFMDNASYLKSILYHHREQIHECFDKLYPPKDKL